jgi:formate hydrogenlyase subunit 6/NADH:ubiquinone oxidoreductase subunit I
MAMNLFDLLRAMRIPPVILAQAYWSRGSDPKLYIPSVCQDTSSGAHHYPILQRHQDGLVRCTGCALCAAACPSKAIFVQAEESQAHAQFSQGTRYAQVFEIDIARCISCGYCVEACPVDALGLEERSLYEVTDAGLEPRLLKSTHF